MPPSFNGKFLDAHYIVFTLLARIFFVKSTCDTKKKSFWFWFSGVSSYFPDPFFRHFKKFLHSVLNDWKFPGDKFWAIKIAVAERYWIPFIKTILCFSRWQSDTQLNSQNRDRQRLGKWKSRKSQMSRVFLAWAFQYFFFKY